MALSRRNFVRAFGLGGVGLSTSFIIGRGREAMAFEAVAIEPPDDGGMIRISSNENARGPSKKAFDALQKAITPRVGRGYPPDYTNDLVETIARRYKVGRQNVIIATGSGPILEAAVRAFCSAGKPLVTAAPTYGTSEATARRIGVPVTSVHVDRTLVIDLDAMADAAVGAGLVYFCNPNNPTGTAHGAAAVERFVRRIKRESPETAIHIDEAYMDYAHDSAVKTASALTQELPRVFISKSFSKAHGMAGLRIGYAVGQQTTVGPIAQASGLGSMNTLSAVAAIASLEDPAHIEAEVKENARVRDFTLQAFRRMGYEASEPHTNHIFVDLGRPASRFREACRSLGVEVGRDFPPMEKTHSRISLGTMDEMRKAVEVFRTVLTAKSTL
jgi:histidinol-phosphate aminotransferase